MKIGLYVFSGVIVFFSSCFFKPKLEEKPIFQSFEDTVSYIMGIGIARNFETDSIDFNTKLLTQGINDYKNDKDTLFSDAEMQQLMQQFQLKITQEKKERQKMALEQNLEKGAAFLTENKKRDAVNELPSGLQIEILHEGTGASPNPTDTVKVHYKGTFIDGGVFDSSYDRGTPIEFPINRVIQGWQEGVPLMKEGGKYKLYIPANLAYGNQDIPGVPGGSTLIFEIELIKIIK